MKTRIKKLVEAWGPSGFEHHIREIIRAEVADLADDISLDPLGNLICRMGTLGANGQRIMVAAHMDEIGLMISHIDKDGFARFAPIGGVNIQHLHGLRVKFENGTIGVISADRGGDRHKLPDTNGFYVDTFGADVKVGDAASFWREMDENGDALISKAMDDRIGCVVALEAMQRLKASGSPNEVYFVFTVQEEVGLRGATTAAYGIAPDFGIALDVTLTGDTPKALKMDVKLGGGAAIKALDGRHIVPPMVRELLVSVAEAENIPYQIEILTGGTTDAAAIQLTQGGVPSGTISIPCRYVHSPSETVNINDVRACVDLLSAVLSRELGALRPQ